MKNETYSSKKQLLEYLLRMIENAQKAKNPLDPADKAAILTYTYGEVDSLLSAIPTAASYREKDLLFTCKDLVLGLMMQLCPSPAELPQEVLAKIKMLVAAVSKEQYIERTLDGIFQQETIGEAEVNHLLSLVGQTEDEYQKGMLYNGLLHYKEDFSKLSDGANACIKAHLEAEFKRYLASDEPAADCINNLELMADVSRYFADGTILALLHAVMKLEHGNVNYFVADTLLSLGQTLPDEALLSLARNLEYANLTYALLGKFGKQDLFPKEYSVPEYLAKSDLVHWLTYPTELGKAPDEIVYIGKITYLFKKEVYYVFKYRSNSDTLNDELKNKWLIGWSSDDGGTFSSFDEYALFEKSTTDATLKNIKRKLIG